MRTLRYYFLRPSHIVLIGDIFLFALGYITSLFIYYRILSIIEVPVATVFIRGSIHLILAVVFWRIFRIYRRVIRHFHSLDYLRLMGIIFYVHLFSFGVRFIIPYVISSSIKVSAVIYVLSFFITTLYIILSRLIVSYLFSYYQTSKTAFHHKRLLIYGAGELGLILKKTLETHEDHGYNLIAFLDDDPYKAGQYIQGIKVYNAGTSTKEAIIINGITDIIIATKSLNPYRKARFLEDTIGFNIRIREIPSLKTWFSSNFSLDILSNIDINDLMNREPIRLYEEHVAQAVNNKTILVTGAAGSIGSEIVRKLAQHNAADIVCLDVAESCLYDLQQELNGQYDGVNFHYVLADVRREEELRDVFAKYQPSKVFHAAAYKHVPLMEEHPWQAVQTNVMGTLNVVKLSVAFNVRKFILISTDKAVNPTSVMGATKKLAEQIVQSYQSTNTFTNFIITRFGNVLGSNGSVVPLFKKQILNGGPVTVTHPEMVRYFMTIPEACQLVLEASAMGKGGEVFVFDMGKPVKIIDLARNMIRLAGYIPDIEIPIKIIGQRPGEKLYEDLFSDKEKMKETYHEKIMISQEKKYDISVAENIVNRLRMIENTYDNNLHRLVIEDLIPEYAGAAVVKNTPLKIVS